MAIRFIDADNTHLFTADLQDAVTDFYNDNGDCEVVWKDNGKFKIIITKQDEVSIPQDEYKRLLDAEKRLKQLEAEKSVKKIFEGWPPAHHDIVPAGPMWQGGYKLCDAPEKRVYGCAH